MNRLTLFVASVVTFVSGFIIFCVFAFYGNLLIQSLGALLVVISMYLLGKARRYGKYQENVPREDQVNGYFYWHRPRPVAWVIAVILLMACIISFLYLFQYGDEYGHGRLALYLSVGFAVSCAVVWPYLITKQTWGKKRG